VPCGSSSSGRGALGRGGEGEGIGGLGILLLHELALDYSKARRQLWAWLDEWEFDFYRSRRERTDTLADLRQATDFLGELHRLHGEFRRRLSALNLPREMTATGWFDGVTIKATADGVDEIVDRSLDNLRGFSNTVRDSVSLTGSYATARRLALAEEQRQASEKQQRRFELITALLLEPTLIAGVYGANTSLPGRNDWNGFALMVGMMVAGAAFTFSVLERARRRGGQGAAQPRERFSREDGAEDQHSEQIGVYGAAGDQPA